MNRIKLKKNKVKRENDLEKIKRTRKLIIFNLTILKEDFNFDEMIVYNVRNYIFVVKFYI